MPDARPPQKNQLLAALDDEVWQRWQPPLEFLEIPLGHVLYESGKMLSQAYSPHYIHRFAALCDGNGASAEIAVVGNEGLVGVSLFMGGGSTPSRAVVQSAGQGFRMKAGALKEEFERGGSVLHLLLRYTQALITQMAQTADSTATRPADLVIVCAVSPRRQAVVRSHCVWADLSKEVQCTC